MIKELIKNIAVLLKSCMTRLTAVEELGKMVSSDSTTGQHQLSFPDTSTWRYMVISVYRSYNNTTPTFQNIVFSNQSFTQGVLMMGGYYASSGDFGICNVNINMSNGGGTVSIRNFTYAGQNLVSSASISIRCYK